MSRYQGAACLRVSPRVSACLGVYCWFKHPPGTRKVVGGYYYHCSILSWCLISKYAGIWPRGGQWAPTNTFRARGANKGKNLRTWQLEFTAATDCDTQVRRKWRHREQGQVPGHWSLVTNNKYVETGRFKHLVVTFARQEGVNMPGTWSMVSHLARQPDIFNSLLVIFKVLTVTFIAV